MTSSDVPEGTISDVLAWVDDDPARAEAALDAEYNGQVRSTLINQLEAIAAKEAPVSDTTTTEAEVDEVEEVPAPEQPEEVVIDANDTGLSATAAVVRDAEVEVDPLMPEPEATEADEPETLPIENELVVSLQSVSNTNALIIAINGTNYGFDKNMVASLKQAVDKAVVGLAL